MVVVLLLLLLAVQRGEKRLSVFVIIVFFHAHLIEWKILEIGNRKFPFTFSFSFLMYI